RCLPASPSPVAASLPVTYLPSFPTRRSSDLTLPTFAVDWQRVRAAITPRCRLLIINSPHNPSGTVLGQADLDALADIVATSGIRSEEHTSELQSRFDLVCRLLLEKNKQINEQ